MLLLLLHHYLLGSGATETTSTSTTEMSSTSTQVNTSTAADVSSTTDSIVVPEEVSTELNETVSGVQDAVNNTLAELSSVSANITDPGLLSNITDLEDSIGELGNLLSGSNLLGGLGRFKRGTGLFSKRIQNDLNLQIVPWSTKASFCTTWPWERLTSSSNNLNSFGLSCLQKAWKSSFPRLSSDFPRSGIS